MRSRFFAILLAFALFAGACGSEPETVVIGAAADDASADAGTDVGEETSDVVGEGASVENASEEPPVADDSSPTIEREPCKIVGNAGPLDPAAVLIDVAGGRWGDDALGVASGGDDYGMQSEGLTSSPDCDANELADDCLGYLMFLGDAVQDFRATARDDSRDHELDNYAADVGVDAHQYVDAFDQWLVNCPTVEFDGERARLDRLDLEHASAAEFTLENEQVWIAVLARENVFSLLVIQPTGDDQLVEADVADFERLVDIWRTQLENAPLS